MASLRKSERLTSRRGHGCFTISPLQLPTAAARFPSHGSGRPGLELWTATKLSSAGFEPTAVLTFGLRVRRLNHSATHSLSSLAANKQTFMMISAIRSSCVTGIKVTKYIPVLRAQTRRQKQTLLCDDDHETD